MSTLNNFYNNKSPLNLVSIINNSSNKNISNKKIDFDGMTKYNNIKKINPVKKTISRNNIITNEKSIKVNKSNYFTSFKKDKNSAPLKKKFLKSRLRNKSIYDDNNNSTFNRSRKEKSPNSRNIINAIMKNKEFNKIILFESLNNDKSQLKETIKINIKNINKILIKNKSMDKYNNNEYPGNNKQNNNANDYNINNNIIHFNNTERRVEKENKYIKSTKLIKAQEKWKRNYLATEIQKTFRGFIYRKKFWSNYCKNKKDNNIYIKKLPKKKSTGIFRIKISHKNNSLTKNRILEKINNINETKKELLNTRNYSIQQFPKIKEIIIRRRRNSPVVNLNLNNYTINGYNDNYNVFKKNSFLKNCNIKINSYRNDSTHKYSETNKILIKKRWNHWVDISLKNKIIKGFINLRMKDSIYVKNDETYNSTNPISEEKRNINVRKNTKLFYVKPK